MIAFEDFVSDTDGEVRLSDHQKVSLALMNLVRDHGAALPDKTYAVLADLYGSPVVRVTFSAEALWAGLPVMEAGEPRTAVQILTGRLAQYCVQNGFSSLGQTDRGARMVLALRRELGDETVTQELADDPATLAQFRPV